MYEIVDNLEVPASAARTRQKGEFATTLDALSIGQGFQFESKGTLKGIYPRVSPKKFGGKRFKVWQVSEGENGAPNTFAVKRENDRVVAAADDNDE